MDGQRQRAQYQQHHRRGPGSACHDEGRRDRHGADKTQGTVEAVGGQPDPGIKQSDGCGKCA
jgi:hypothetical protein